MQGKATKGTKVSTVAQGTASIPNRRVRYTLVPRQTTPKIKAKTIWKRTMFAPFMNMAFAFPQHSSTLHTASPNSRPNGAENCGPIHHARIVRDSRSSAVAATHANPNTSRSERPSVLRTHGTSPREIASAYAGQSGVTIIPTIMAIIENILCGMEYSGTWDTPRTRAMMMLSAENETETTSCSTKNSVPKPRIFRTSSLETRLNLGLRSGLLQPKKCKVLSPVAITGAPASTPTSTGNATLKCMPTITPARLAALPANCHRFVLKPSCNPSCALCTRSSGMFSAKHAANASIDGPVAARACADETPKRSGHDSQPMVAEKTVSNTPPTLPRITKPLETARRIPS